MPCAQDPTKEQVGREEKETTMNQRKRGRIRTRRKAAKKAAQHLPAHLQDVAFTKHTGRFHKMKLGTFGAASPVRHVDPAEYEGGI